MTATMLAAAKPAPAINPRVQPAQLCFALRRSFGRAGHGGRNAALALSCRIPSLFLMPAGLADGLARKECATDSGLIRPGDIPSRRFPRFALPEQHEFGGLGVCAMYEQKLTQASDTA